MKYYFILRQKINPALPLEWNSQHGGSLSAAMADHDQTHRDWNIISWCDADTWSRLRYTEDLNNDEIHAMNLEAGRGLEQALLAAPIKKKQPVVCPEVWAVPNPDADYMAAVRDMCKGVS